MSFYEKICEQRQVVLMSDPSSEIWNDKLQTLLELMVVAFSNWQTPDELPKIFNIRNIEFMKSKELKCFLQESLHINVHSVDWVGTDILKGRTYRIELF